MKIKVLTFIITAASLCLSVHNLMVEKRQEERLAKIAEMYESLSAHSANGVAQSDGDTPASVSEEE